MSPSRTLPSLSSTTVKSSLPTRYSQPVLTTASGSTLPATTTSPMVSSCALAHSRTTRLMRKQMDIPRPLAKQAWANIVRRKIENQTAVLRFCSKNGVDRMDSYVRRVRSGDLQKKPRRPGRRLLLHPTLWSGLLSGQKNAGPMPRSITAMPATRRRRPGLVAHGTHRPLPRQQQAETEKAGGDQPQIGVYSAIARHGRIRLRRAHAATGTEAGSGNSRLAACFCGG